MDKIKASLQEYFAQWRVWAKAQSGFDFTALKPMHMGWKVPNETALGEEVSRLLRFTQDGHIGTVDNRKIALLALKEPVEGVPVVQIMQLRPGSTDALGFDHVAFYCQNMPGLQAALEKTSHKWEHQSNTGHEWISLWFGDKQREVKFFDHTSLDLGARDLAAASEKIKSR
jgi:hypothetical protein